jgi:hypothetical protein
MPAKKVIRFAGDVREHPRYSIEEAASYLHVPASTMKAWMRGQHYRTSAGVMRTFLPVIRPADPKNKLLSFYNLAEAHILRATRERSVPLRNVRAAINWVRTAIPDGPHPMLSVQSATFGKQVFIDHLGEDRVLTDVLLS